MRPISAKRGGSLTTRFQSPQRTPQRTPQRFGKEHYLYKNNKHFLFEEIIQIPQMKRLKPTIHIPKLTERINKFKYLPLHYFEDSSFDKYSNEDLCIKIQEQGIINIFTLKDGEFVESKITGYDVKNARFLNGEESIERLYFICEFEDVKMYIRKFEKALSDREAMDAYLKYNYYIDNMQTQDIPELNQIIIDRILKLIGKQMSGQIEVINQHFKRVQNQLQFNEYLKRNKDLIKFQIIQQIKKPLFGKLQLKFDQMQIIQDGCNIIQSTSFEQVKKQFQESYLLSNSQFINAFYKVNELNKQISELSIFYFDENPFSIHLLKERQDHLISKQQKIISKWSENIKQIMISCDLPKTQQYRIIQVLRIKQQDSLQKLIDNNLFQFQTKLQQALKQNSLLYSISVGYFGQFQYSVSLQEMFQIWNISLESQLLEYSKIRDPEAIFDISDMMYIQSPTMKDQNIKLFIENVENYIAQIMREMNQHLNNYNKYKYIFECQLNDFVKDSTSNDGIFNINSFKQQIDQLTLLRNQLTLEIQSTNRVSIFLIDNSHLLFQLTQLLDQMIQDMIQYIADTACQQNKVTVLNYQKLQLKIKKLPNDILELEQQRVFLTSKVEVCLQQLKQDVDKVMEIYQMLDQLTYIATQEQNKERWNLLSFLNISQNNIKETLIELQERRIQQKQDLYQDIISFKYQIDDQERKVNHYIKNYQTNQVGSQEYLDKLIEMKAQATLINKYELVFDMERNNFGKIDFIISQLQPLQNLNRIMNEWKGKIWMQTPIEELDVNFLQELVSGSVNQLNDIGQSQQKNATPIYQLTKQLLIEIQEFSIHLNLLFALKEVGMKERHWEQISLELKRPFELKGLTLQNLISELNQKEIDFIIQISQFAKQELIVENTYIKIFQEYKSLIVQIMKPRVQLQNIQLNKLINLDQLIQTLDDGLCTISVLIQSQFHEPLHKELNELEQLMVRSQTYIEEFQQLQTIINYIHPFIYQPDLQKQLPIEVTRFKLVEKFWKSASSELAQHPLYQFKGCNLQDNISKLLGIEKSLANYIDKKREIFCRFHFLSDQQIMILSSKPHTPNEFINQIFSFHNVIIEGDSIIQLQNIQDNLDIDPVQIGRNVEDWLQELVIKMKKSLKSQFRKQKKCTQIRKLLDRISFTQQGAQYQGNNQQLLQRAKRLSQLPEDSFEKEIQLKYYIDSNFNVQIQFLNYKFEYDFEFLVENDYFIETPQTDRCFANLAFAIGNYYGVCMYGESGKIETIHEFSRNLGKYFITMNAQLANYSVLSHLCKGVAATSSYLVLINQMEPQLLTIFINLVKVMYFAIRNQLEVIELDGNTVKVEKSFSIMMVRSTNQISHQVKNYFRLIYFQKLDKNIFIDYYSKIYNIQDSYKLKCFLDMIEINPKKLRQLFEDSQSIQLEDSIQKHFPQHSLLIDQIWPNKSYESKVQMFNLVFGKSLSGKSKLIKQLYPNCQRIYIQSFNKEYYFGSFNSDGILSKLKDNPIVIDSKLTDSILDSLISIILFQQLRLPNGKVKQIKQPLIFETISIKRISPSTILRLTLNFCKEIQIDIPIIAQPFISLAGAYKSPLSINAQIQSYKMILEKNGYNELQLVQAATWAFGGSLAQQHKALFNRHLKEIWQGLPNRKYEPQHYDNLFELVIVDNDFVIQNEKIELLQNSVVIKKLIPIFTQVMIVGPSNSGKSTFLQDPYQFNMTSTANQLKEFIESKYHKKRNTVYSIKQIQIDDLHMQSQCYEFIRQLVDDNGYYDVQLVDLQMLITTQRLNKQRLLRHFVIISCEQPDNQTISQILQQNGFFDSKQLFEVYNNCTNYLNNLNSINKKIDQSIQITQYDFWRAAINFSLRNPCQHLLSSIYFKLKNEEQQLEWIKTNSQFKLEEPQQQINDLLQENNLMQFDGNLRLLNYLIILLKEFQINNKLLVYGPFGIGKKTLCKIAGNVVDKNIIPYENPNIELVSILVQQKEDVVITMISQTLEYYIKRIKFLQKFQIVYFSHWPEDVFQICEIGYQIYKYIEDSSNKQNWLNNYQMCPKYFLNYNILQNRLIQEKETKITKEINTLSNGLQLLYSAQQSIHQMNAKLNQIKPILENAVNETQEFLVQLISEKQIAQEAQINVIEKEQIAHQNQQEASRLSEECQMKVDLVNKQLEETLQDVQKLKKDHLIEIKSLLQPPKQLKIILGGLVILLSEQMKYNINSDDYFDIAKKYLLNDVKELLDLLKKTKNNISINIIQQLEIKIINDTEFTYEKAKQCSLAVKYLYSWVKAVYDYNKTYIESQPLRDQLEESLKEFNIKNQHLNIMKQELNQINEKIDLLEQKVKDKNNIKDQLEQQMDECQQKISRSLKLIEGFKDEQKRWTTQIYQLKGEQTKLNGDSIIAATILTYGGPLTKDLRSNLYQHLYKIIDQPFTNECTLNSFYNKNSNDFMQENDNILMNRTLPLIIIDPQRLGRDYFKRIHQYKFLSDIKKVNHYIETGQIICLIDQELILNNQVINIISNSNPILNQETYLNYSIINYTITEQVLIEKIIKCLIEIENPSLELKKNHNLELFKNEEKTLQIIEQQILTILQNQSNIDELLKNEVMVNELHNSKKSFSETNQRIIMGKQLDQEININRDQYRQLAMQFSLIFLQIMQLPNLNEMYCYSLEWFLNLIQKSSSKIQRQSDIQMNIQQMRQICIKSILQEVCCFLTEIQRILFCFKVSLELMKSKGLVSQEEINCFNQCNQKSLFNCTINPCSYIDDNEWPIIKQKLINISKLPIFEKIVEQIEEKPQLFKQLYLHQTFNTEQMQYTQFQKILLTIAFRPDRIISMMISFIESTLQLKYHNINTNIPLMEIDSQTPLIIVGNSNFKGISLPLIDLQKVEHLLIDAMENGQQIEFQNCEYGLQILNQINEQMLNTQIHPSFQLRLQVNDFCQFPIEFLHKSIKTFTKEPRNLIDLLIQLIEKQDNLENQHFFSLTLMHAIWCLRNIYGFNEHLFHETDLQLIQQGKPKELVYLNQLNNIDLFINLFNKTICQQSLREGFIYMGGELKMIRTNKEGYLQYLKDLGQVNDFNCIGLNNNLQISTMRQLVEQYILNKKQNDFINLNEQLEKLERYTPLKLIELNIENKIDLIYVEERINFNKLIDQMQQFIIQINYGDISQNILQIIDSLQMNKVPKQWIKLSQIYEDIFSDWMKRIFDKGQFFSKWRSQCCFNLQHISDPKKFLNLVKLEYALTNKCSLPEIKFRQVIIKEHYLEIRQRPNEGVLLSQLKLRGAKFNELTQKMKALGHLEFYSELPVLHIIPDILIQQQGFSCPLERNGKIITNFYFDTPDPLQLYQVGIEI